MKILCWLRKIYFIPTGLAFIHRRGCVDPARLTEMNLFCICNSVQTCFLILVLKQIISPYCISLFRIICLSIKLNYSFAESHFISCNGRYIMNKNFLNKTQITMNVKTGNIRKIVKAIYYVYVVAKRGERRRKLRLELTQRV